MQEHDPFAAFDQLVGEPHVINVETIHGIPPRFASELLK